MSLPRFFLPGPWPTHPTIGLPDDAAHHALRVLRLDAGTMIEIFDGAGCSAQGALQVHGKQASLTLQQPPRQDARPPLALTLVQGIASGDKMDWIVEKATELGIATIVPVAAHRSVLKLGGERRTKRWQHWQRVAQAACAQCGRNHLPTLAEPQTLEAWLASPGPSAAPMVLCDPAASGRLLPWLRQQRPAALTLLVGPEGGWSPDEQALVLAAGGQALSHGGHVLRTETAGLALASACAAVLSWTD